MSTSYKIDFANLPTDYISRKFYEYGFNVTHNRGDNTYNCCCPICMEGKSFGKKKRCWYLPSKNLIYCHNCGRGFSPYNWITEVGNLTAKDVIYEIESGEYTIENLDKRKKEEEAYALKIEYKPYNLLGLPDDSIDLTDKLELDYYSNNKAVQKALAYIRGRRLDTAINKPTKFYISTSNGVHKNRLIFPFFENKSSVPFYQSRAIGANLTQFNEDVRYLSKKGAVKSIFNYDRISDEIDDIFVFEGPIDSCFCRNGVAVAGISEGGGLDLTPLQQSQLERYSLTHRIVWMLDSQYLDSTSRNKTKKLLQSGECVFIWPEKEGRKYKDFNEWCIAEGLDEVPLDYIRENIRCWYSDMLMVKFEKDWLYENQSSDEDFYGDFNPSIT